MNGVTESSCRPGGSTERHEEEKGAGRAQPRRAAAAGTTLPARRSECRPGRPTERHEEDESRPVPVYTAEPTLARFHRSGAFVRGVRGPIGGGKSVGCCGEVMRRCVEQKPFHGVRRSRWAIIRNTYGELRTTTIKTWLDWYGAVTRMVYGHPIIGTMQLPLPDGTRMLAELNFISLDRPVHVRKLKSLELTGAWLNEASELPFEVLEMVTGRVDRYPSKMQGGPSWTGVIMDTNSCDVSNWWYRLAEEEKPEGYEFFAQPPALLPVRNGDGTIRYEPNPEAENIRHHTSGFGYYLRQVPGKPKSWVKVFILNQYGSPDPGHLVYPEYSEKNLTDRQFDPGMDIVWSHDFNFTPLSSVIMQRDGDTVYAVDEIVLQSAVARQAAAEFCERYRGFGGVVYLYGDASGRQGEKHGHDSDYIALERELKRNGFRVQRRDPASNPPIKDGQASLNAKICDATERRTFFVNAAACPTLHKGLSALKLKEGSTFQEEDAPYQHITTAVRYYTALEFPMRGGGAFFGHAL
mgnify:CR=1 FL=1